MGFPIAKDPLTPAGNDQANGMTTTPQHEKQTWKDRPRKDARLELRVPGDLLAALRTVAAGNDRTINAECRRALRFHCERETREPAP